MDNTILILIIVTNLILAIILVTLIIFIINYYFKSRNQLQPNSQDSYHPEIKNRISELNKFKSQDTIYCPNHKEEIGEANCAICDHLFCKKCIRPFKSLHFCNEHMPLIMKNEWEEVFKLKTSTEYPEEGVKLYDLKKQIFHKNNLPTYIETHYKIDIHDDYIETYLVLFAIKNQTEEVRKLISAE